MKTRFLFLIWLTIALSPSPRFVLKLSRLNPFPLVKTQNVFLIRVIFRGASICFSLSQIF